MPATKMPDDPSLAAKYRQLLRWYPARWRRENELLFLGMLLDESDCRGSASPALGDRLSIVRGGLKERLLPYQRVPIAHRSALLVGVLFSLYYVFHVAWAPGNQLSGGIGPFANPSILTGAMMCVAWLLAVVRAGISSRVVAAGTTVVSLTVAFAAWRFDWLGPSPECAFIFAATSLAGVLRAPRRTRGGSSSAAS